MTFLQSLMDRAEKPARRPRTTASSLRLEKRRHSRYPDGRSTFIFPVIGSSREVHVVDASSQGMHLVSREALEVGSRMHLILFYGGASARCVVQVLWERSDANPKKKHYGVKLSLSARSDEAQIKQYLKFLRVRSSNGGY